MNRVLVSIVAAVALLAGCASKSDPLVPADGLQQKELDWKVGDERISATWIFDLPNTTTTYDTARVLSYGNVDGYRTLVWSDTLVERVRGTGYERAFFSQWDVLCRMPSTRGEVFRQDTFIRTREDGSAIGKVLLDWVTTSPDTTITLPAGTFRCVAVTTVSRTLTGEVLDDTSDYGFWYVPGTGMVQVETYAPGTRRVRFREHLVAIRRH